MQKIRETEIERQRQKERERKSETDLHKIQIATKIDR